VINRVSGPGAPSIVRLEVLIQTHSMTASKFAPSPSPSLSPKAFDCGVQTRSITASKLAQSRPQSESANSLNYGLQSCSITASMCISKLARLWSASSRDYGLQVHISKLAQSRPWSVSLNPLDYCLYKCISNSLYHHLGMHLLVHSTIASKCTFQYSRLPATKGNSEVARSQPRGVSLSSLECHFQRHPEWV
jgi:hypothetical protein